MVGTKLGGFHFGIDHNFHGEVHRLPLVAQSEASESIHAPHVQVIVARLRAHVKESRRHRRHPALRIKLVPAEQRGRQPFGLANLSHVRPEAQHSVAPHVHIAVVWPPRREKYRADDAIKKQ